MLLAKLCLVLGLLFLLRFPFLLIKLAFHIVRPFLSVAAILVVGLLLTTGFPSTAALSTLTSGHETSAAKVPNSLQSSGLFETAKDFATDLKGATTTYASYLVKNVDVSQMKDNFNESLKGMLRGKDTKRTTSAHSHRASTEQTLARF
jgi:hypothetical protein